MPKPTHAVAIALVQRGQHWLVARRPHDVHLPDLWEFPGGKCHPDEPPATAAVRELHEECAVTAEALHEFPALRCEYSDRTILLTPVLCRWRAGEPQALASQECRWVTFEELSRLDMPEINEQILRQLPHM